MHQKNWAAQLWYLQQVEESMGDGVSGEEAAVHYRGTELSETASKWTPALGDGCFRYFGEF